MSKIAHSSALFLFLWLLAYFISLGWGPAQISEATVWAGDVGDDVVLAVAAADTPADLKNGADYVGDGSTTMGDVAGDEEEINTALGEAHTVMLMPGTFWVNDPILLATGQTLQGSGAGTVIKIRNGKDADLNVITNSDRIDGNLDIYLADFKIDGNQVNQTAGSQRGIDFNGVTHWRIEGVTTDALRGNGIRSRNGSYGQIYKCYISNSRAPGSGIYIYDTHIEVSQCSITGNGGYGIEQSNAHYVKITGCHIWNNARSGIELFANHGEVADNEIWGNSQSGIYVDHASNCKVYGNTVWLNQLMGIDLATYVDHIEVSNNFVHSNSQAMDNTFDNICLSRADYCLIQANICRRGTEANKPRYGINIAGAAAEGSVIVDNDLYDSGSTGDINDAGTGTLKQNNRDLAGNWPSEGVTSELFIPATNDTHGSASMQTMGRFSVIQLADGVVVDTSFTFKVPDDFASLVSAKLVWESPAGSGMMMWRMSAEYGAAGQAYNTHEKVGAYGTTATGGPSVINVQQAATPLTLPNLATGDYVGIVVYRDGVDASDTLNDVVNILGLLFIYNAKE